MRSTNCLNCGKQLTDKFCSGCGQKSDTHRISFKHFIAHDVLHGTFHIEKGILFTAKEALVRPGKAALDYIAGKRIKYYNVFLSHSDNHRVDVIYPTFLQRNSY